MVMSAVSIAAIGSANFFPFKMTTLLLALTVTCLSWGPSLSMSSLKKAKIIEGVDVKPDFNGGNRDVETIPDDMLGPG